MEWFYIKVEIMKNGKKFIILDIDLDLLVTEKFLLEYVYII